MKFLKWIWKNRWLITASVTSIYSLVIVYSGEYKAAVPIMIWAVILFHEDDFLRLKEQIKQLKGEFKDHATHL